MTDPTLPRAAVPTDEPLVYYIRRDGFIKIGYTAHFVNRMRGLRPDELLAVEPGNIPLEEGRHQQFAEYNDRDHPDGREWYYAAQELLDHIARLASIYVTPELPEVPEPRPLAEYLHRRPRLAERAAATSVEEAPREAPAPKARDNDGPLVSTSEAAKAIGVARSTLWRWIKHGVVVPHERTAGGHIRWDVDQLRAEVTKSQSLEESA